MFKREDMICVGCRKTPDQIEEYVEGAADQPADYVDVFDYVMQEEGTLNPATGHFLCTDCYIKDGMPTLDYPKRWVAP